MKLPNWLERKASKAGKLISIGFLGQPAWTPRNYDVLAEESYQKNAVAYRAIAEIGKCASSVPFQLFRGSGEKRIEIEDHPLLNLLRRPNPLQSQTAFIQALFGFYLISGNAYIEKVGPKIGDPRELWLKRPDRMKVIPGKFGLPKTYEFMIGAGSVRWPVNGANGQSNVLHIKSFHPLNDWYGMSPVEAAAFSVDQHNEAGKWNMALLQNSARPSGALIVDPKAGTGLDDEGFEKLKAQIEESYSGPLYAGRPLLLEGGLDWKEMGFKPVDMDWLQGKHTSARDIAMVFGMPAQMLGIPGDNTHRNMEEARLWLWEQTILPLLELFLTELNWWLTPLFGEELVLAFDYDAIPALVVRRHALWDKVRQSDFLTVDEKRKATGYAPLPGEGGDAVLVPRRSRRLDEPEPSKPSKANGEDQDAFGKPVPKGKGTAKTSGQA